MLLCGARINWRLRRVYYNNNNLKVSILLLRPHWTSASLDSEEQSCLCPRSEDKCHYNEMIVHIQPSIVSTLGDPHVRNKVVDICVIRWSDPTIST